MGNLLEGNKFSTPGHPLEDVTLTPKTKVKKNEDDYDFTDFFTGDHDPRIGQLIGWSLPEIRSIYDKYRRLSQFPIMDRIMFSKIMPFSKRNSMFIFEYLASICKTPYLSIYEVICLLTILAYSNMGNKIKLLFAVFDFSCSFNLSFPEWHVLVISFLQIVARLLNKKFPSKQQMERVAKIIFIKADIAPYDNSLDFIELREWIETASPIAGLFQKYEPKYTIKEKASLFYSFRQFTDPQIDAMYKQITSYGIPHEAEDDIKELIEKSARAGVYASSKVLEDVNSPPGSRRGSSIKPIEILPTPKSKELSKLKSKTSPVNSLKSPLLKEIILPPINSPKTTISFKPQRFTTLSPSTSAMNIKPERDLSPKNLIKKRKELLAKSRPLKRNVLITNGRTISKKDIINLKTYFDSIAEGTDKLTLKNFVRSFSKNSNLEKVSAGLFNFLDDKSHGYVTFPELLEKLYPDLKSLEYEQLCSWSIEEDQIFQSKANKNYFDETLHLSNNKQQKSMFEVPKEAIKKMKYIFDLYDEEKKGYISQENLLKKFSSGYTPKEVEKKFKEADKDRDGTLNLKEFIEMILPHDFYLDPSYLNGV